VAGALADAMSHDLKNPVCIARFCSDLIAEPNWADGHLRELSKMLTGTVNGILGMTLDLLDYARGSVSVNKRPVSIWRLLDELESPIPPSSPEQNIEFVKPISYQGHIEIDLGRFARAIGNVIENAMHAMPGGGFLTVRIDVVENQVQLRISIPAPEFGRADATLFDLSNVTGDSHANGVGLAVAKAIVEAHGVKFLFAALSAKATTVESVCRNRRRIMRAQSSALPLAA